MNPTNDFAQMSRFHAFKHILDKYRYANNIEPKVIFRCDLISEAKSFIDADPDTKIHKATMAFISEYEKRIVNNTALMESMCVSHKNIVDEEECVVNSKICDLDGIAKQSFEQIRQ